MYSEFEDNCYKTIEAGGSLNADELAGKWLELARSYYGDSFYLPQEYGIEWARIPHMYYNYYVYQYATSITYASSVCRQVDEKGQEEIDAYIDFLKAGNYAAPASLLSIAGVDPLDDATYQAAGEYIGGLIDEYIALIQK
jgi:oligoendopeptidase F